MGKVKGIRDRNSGNAGCCFIDIRFVEAAQKALETTGAGDEDSAER